MNPAAPSPAGGPVLRGVARLFTKRPPAELRRTPRDPWPGLPSRGQCLLDDPDGMSARLRARAELDDEKALAPHRFSWLRHLRGIGGDRGRQEARRLVALWLDAHERVRGPAWRADIAGRRAFAWLGSYEFFAGSAEEVFRSRVTESLYAHFRHTARAGGTLPAGIPRLAALTGELSGAIAFDEPIAPVVRRVEQEILRQMRSDGFHRSRSPAAQFALLRRLIEIRGLLRAANADAPDGLIAAIGRAGSALAFFRHGDRRLACFHGTHEAEASDMELTLARADARARPPASSETGFERLQAMRSAVVVDAGIPDTGFNRGAHASPLAFEFSDGAQRIVVNCGPPPADGPAQWTELARATAAHSTATVGDTHSFAIVPGGGVLAEGVRVTSERAENEQGLWLDLTHNGYVRPFGLVHRRRLFLSAAGDELRGEDVLEGTTDSPFCIRFHLHPKLKVRPDRKGSAVDLRLPKGKHWRFMSNCGNIELADSVYFGSGALERCTAIFIQGETAGRGAKVKWGVPACPPETHGQAARHSRISAAVILSSTRPGWSGSSESTYSRTRTSTWTGVPSARRRAGSA